MVAVSSFRGSIVRLSLPQSRFFTSTNKYTAAVAGYGSGKTEVAIRRLLSSMIKYPGMDMGYLAPTYSLIRDIFYPRISEIADTYGLDITIKENKNYVALQDHGKIFCRTMDRPHLIVGWQCGDILLDEWDILTKQKGKTVFNKILARARQKFPDGKKNQIYVTTTPEGFKHTYNYFKKEPLEDSRLIQMSTYSNEDNLEENYISDLKKIYPEELVDSYINGKFVNLLSGTVYYSFDRRNHASKITAFSGEPLHIGMDFNVYKMAAIVHVIRKGIVYAVDEFTNYRDTPDIVKAIQNKYDNPITVYPDPSCKNKSSKNASESDLSILQNLTNWIIRVRESHPLIKERVQAVNKKIQKGEYFINVDMCPVLTECLEQQVYDINTGQPDKSSDLDHPVDALGYFIEYKWPIIRHLFMQSIIGGN